MTAAITIFLFPFFYAIIRAVQDAYVRHEEKVFHAANACLNILIAVTVAILATNSVIIFTAWEYLQIFFCQLFIYWFMFDGCYNILTGEPFFYVGHTAVLDKLQQKYKVLFVLKIALFPVSLLILTQFSFR